MKIKLTEIGNVEPRRAHGNIKELAESIKREGLLQPLVINQNNKLICGRRRFEAVRLLGWDGVEVYQIKTEDDIDGLSKAITENVMRLNLTWQEEVTAKEELDQLMREKFGERKRGQDTKSSPNEDLWSTRKTSQLLQEAEGKTIQDIQLAREIKKDPEIVTGKTY